MEPLEKPLPHHLKLVMDITYECNLSCPNCDRQCSMARTKDEMTVEQVEKFIRESLEIGYPWGRVLLSGGEPTLHPRLFQIASLLLAQSPKFNQWDVAISTNGRNPRVISGLPKGVRICEWGKKDGLVDWHFTVNRAPMDEHVVRDFYPCWSPCRALTLNKFGYYHSSPCACVDRVFGFNIGVKTLQEAMRNGRAALNAQKKRLCRYCGYARDQVSTSTVQETGPTWAEAFRKYRENPPVMTVY